MGKKIPPAQRAEIMDEIFARMAEGESLRTICKSKHIPNRVTIGEWLEADPDLAAKCARARELQADALFDETLEITDAATPEDAHAVRVKADYRRWYMARCAPKKYGDKTEITGAGGAPLVPQIEAGESMRRLVFAIAGAAAGLIGGGADADKAETETIEGQAKRIPDGGVSDA